MYLPKYEYFVLIVFSDYNRIALPLEDNLGFVDEILKRKNQ